jgi:RimJ/RimL family protein N-acetyltransferase
LTETRSAQLVRMDVNHLEATRGWLLDDELRRQVDTTEPPTRERNCAYWRARWADSTQESYAILTPNGEHVGNCGLINVDRQRRKAELWAYLGTSRGEGVGSTAVLGLLARAFSELGLNRVCLRVLATNQRAECFYRRLGFRPEGRARQDTWIDGQPVDSIWLSILAEDYFGGTSETRAPGAAKFPPAGAH